MSDDNLQDEVNDLREEVQEVKGELEAVKQDISWLRRAYNGLVDRLRSAGGHLGRIGRGDDEKK